LTVVGNNPDLLRAQARSYRGASAARLSLDVPPVAGVRLRIEEVLDEWIRLVLDGDAGDCLVLAVGRVVLEARKYRSSCNVVVL